VAVGATRSGDAVLQLVWLRWWMVRLSWDVSFKFSALAAHRKTKNPYKFLIAYHAE
jgi:hypothetical protein